VYIVHPEEKEETEVEEEAEEAVGEMGEMGIVEERQIEIDQEYQRRKENAARQLQEGMKEFKDKI